MYSTGGSIIVISIRTHGQWKVFRERDSREEFDCLAIGYDAIPRSIRSTPFLEGLPRRAKEKKKSKVFDLSSSPNIAL